MKGIQVPNKCSINGCGGDLDTEEPRLLMISCSGCGSYSRAYPCKKCKRMHWAENGEPVCNKAGEEAFLNKDGEVFFKKTQT